MRLVRALVGLVALLGVASAPMAQSNDISPDTKTEVIQKVSDYLEHHAYVPTVDFSEWNQFLKNEQPKLDASTTEEAFTRAMNEAFAKFGASHIYLASPRATKNRMTASMVGIGIRQEYVPDMGLVVMRVIPGGAAEKAGLVIGDVITKVDGKPIEGTKGIPGEEGTKLTLTIKHKDGKSKDYVLTRTKFSTIQPEELTEVDPDTAKLTIYTFDRTYDPENVQKLMSKARAYPNLILDLRDNGGGAVDNLEQLLSFFVGPDDRVGTFVSKAMVDDYARTTGNKADDVTKIAAWSRGFEKWDRQQIGARPDSDEELYKGHVAVLINGFSGSASEICAAALHDVIGATLIGQKSAGAVLVSVIKDASNGFTVQYPIMDYVTVRGVRLEGNGITPQVAIEAKKYRMPGDPDLAVEKAQALFAHEKLRDDRGIG
ncbi:MAG TPA: S41 family peptidase [Fimbriimonas sp.]|nr:S41 family peptidase [Fimbriimonas sp.]